MVRFAAVRARSYAELNDGADDGRDALDVLTELQQYARPCFSTQGRPEIVAQETRLKLPTAIEELSLEEIEEIASRAAIHHQAGQQLLLQVAYGEPPEGYDTVLQFKKSATPISATYILCRDEEDGRNKRLLRELRRIEYLEKVVMRQLEMIDRNNTTGVVAGMIRSSGQFIQSLQQIFRQVENLSKAIERGLQNPKEMPTAEQKAATIQSIKAELAKLSPASPAQIAIKSMMVQQIEYLQKNILQPIAQRTHVRADVRHDLPLQAKAPLQAATRAEPAPQRQTPRSATPTQVQTVKIADGRRFTVLTNPDARPVAQRIAARIPTTAQGPERRTDSLLKVVPAVPTQQHTARAQTAVRADNKAAPVAHSRFTVLTNLAAKVEGKPIVQARQGVRVTPLRPVTNLAAKIENRAAALQTAAQQRSTGTQTTLRVTTTVQTTTQPAQQRAAVTSQTTAPVLQTTLRSIVTVQPTAMQTVIQPMRVDAPMQHAAIIQQAAGQPLAQTIHAETKIQPAAVTPHIFTQSAAHIDRGIQQPVAIQQNVVQPVITTLQVQPQTQTLAAPIEKPVSIQQTAPQGTLPIADIGTKGQQTGTPATTSVEARQNNGTPLEVKTGTPTQHGHKVEQRVPDQITDPHQKADPKQQQEEKKEAKAPAVNDPKAKDGAAEKKPIEKDFEKNKIGCGAGCGGNCGSCSLSTMTLTGKNNVVLTLATMSQEQKDELKKKFAVQGSDCTNCKGGCPGCPARTTVTVAEAKKNKRVAALRQTSPAAKSQLTAA